MKHLRKIIKICIAHRWIIDDQFTFYKIKVKAKEKGVSDECRTSEDRGKVVQETKISACA